MTRSLLLAGAALLLLAAPARAQTPSQPIEDFVEQVAWLWGMGDVAAIVDLLPPSGRVKLDTGTGSESVTSRHAAAALRALFDSRETDDARAVRATLAGSEPPRGFGELEWAFRRRGAPGSRTCVVFIAATWEGESWRIRELRVMP